MALQEAMRGTAGADEMDRTAQGENFAEEYPKTKRYETGKCGLNRKCSYKMRIIKESVKQV